MAADQETPWEAARITARKGRKRGGVQDDIIRLGPAPAEEDCAQVGSRDYTRNAKVECRASVEAIRKACGQEPEGARLTIKSQPHDFGSYYEVAVVFDGSNPAAAEYATKCDDANRQRIV